MGLTVEAALHWIRNRSQFGARPGLERVEAFLKRIGNPEEKLPTLHIAGTNGKGSTVTYLRCMLQEAGLRVGTFISPYVLHYNEQIAINGEYIKDAAIIKYVERHQKLVEKMDEDPLIAGITEFEVVTVIALDYFVDEQVDVAIVEVGMGGLLDSTNVVKPLLVGITTIGKDHTDFLGNTLEEIATHKAGIIKESVPVVTGNIGSVALSVIKKIAANNHSATYCYGEAYRIEYQHADDNWGEVFNFYGEIGKLENVKVPLLGQHQCENAAVSIQLFFLFCQRHQPRLVQDLGVYVNRGIAKAQWPARMERVNEKPLIILDGAHNDHAVNRLAQNLKNRFTGCRIHILFSALSTKNVDKMIELLKQVPDVQMYLTTFEYPKAVELEIMAKYEDQQAKVVPIWQSAVEEIAKNTTVEEVMLVTGSLYFVSQVRPVIFELIQKR